MMVKCQMMGVYCGPFGSCVISKILEVPTALVSCRQPPELRFQVGLTAVMPRVNGDDGEIKNDPYASWSEEFPSFIHVSIRFWDVKRDPGYETDEPIYKARSMPDAVRILEEHGWEVDHQTIDECDTSDED